MHALGSLTLFFGGYKHDGKMMRDSGILKCNICMLPATPRVVGRRDDAVP